MKIHENYVKQNAKFFAIGVNPKPLINNTTIHVSWRKPLKGWGKLNTNGASLGSGGLIRDY